MAAEFKLRIVTPDRAFDDEDVTYVRFTGVDGSYGILPNHAPMITATRPGPIVAKLADGTRRESVLTDGFAEFRNNTLVLVCEAGETGEQIDMERARRAEERARKRLAEKASLSHEEFARAEAALRRAIMRLQVGERHHAR